MRVLLISAFALIAATAFGAAPAGAATKFTAKQRAILRDCPVENAELIKAQEEFLESHEASGEGVYCFAGITKGGKEGGAFTVGGVKTNLNKKITLHGAFSISTEHEGEGKIWAPKDGKTLEAPPLVVTKGIKLVTPQIQEEAGWPQALKDIYNDKIAKHESGLSATIEVAGGNLMYENRNGVNPFHLIEEVGDAFVLPLKVKLSGPLLYKLQKGADTCSIGDDEHPVVQHLTSGTSEAPFPYEANTSKGSAGELRTNESGTTVELLDSTLVDSTWHVDIPAVGCGGEYESYVNDAISKVLSIPAPAGASTTILKGSLYLGYFPVAKEEQEAHGEV